MIWLGRTEIVLTKFHRDFVASFLIQKTLNDSGVMGIWEAVDQAIQAFVGKSDNLTPVGFDKFFADQ